MCDLVIAHHRLTHDFTAIDPCVAVPLIRLVICRNLNIQLKYGWQPYFNNFGPDFEGWIHIISRNVKMCVIQNGFFSQFFLLGEDADKVTQFHHTYSYCV